MWKNHKRPYNCQIFSYHFNSICVKSAFPEERTALLPLFKEKHLLRLSYISSCLIQKHTKSEEIIIRHFYMAHVCSTLNPQRFCRIWAMFLFLTRPMPVKCSYSVHNEGPKNMFITKVCTSGSVHAFWWLKIIIVAQILIRQQVPMWDAHFCRVKHILSGHNDWQLFLMISCRLMQKVMYFL